MSELTYSKYRELIGINHGAMVGILRVVKYERNLPSWLLEAAADVVADYEEIQKKARYSAESRMIENEG